jgi:hypothetical protein
MIAIVKELDHNASIGSYPTIKLVVENCESGKESFYNVFKNLPKGGTNPLATQVSELSPGQRVKLNVQKNGKYFNYAGHEVLENAPSTGGNGNNGSRGSKDEEIRRAVSLKAAVELVAASMTGKSNPKEAAEVAVSIAPIFEPYLESGVNLGELMAGISGSEEDADADTD